MWANGGKCAFDILLILLTSASLRDNMPIYVRKVQLAMTCPSQRVYKHTPVRIYTGHVAATFHIQLQSRSYGRNIALTLQRAILAPHSS